MIHQRGQRFGSCGSDVCVLTQVLVLVLILVLELVLGPGHSGIRAASADDMERQVRDRALIDAYQARHHRVAPGIIPTPLKRFPPRDNAAEAVRIHRVTLDDAVVAYRATNVLQQTPRAGFRAPILDRVDRFPELPRPNRELTPVERDIAALVDRRLSKGGLLATLVEALALRSKGENEREEDKDSRAEDSLRRAGFPTDLLDHFEFPGSLAGSGSGSDSGAAVMASLLKRLAEGESPVALKAKVAQAKFAFRATEKSYRVRSEEGTAPIRMLRMQAGGGWNDGVVPGGGIDLIFQLIAALPGRDFLISVPNEVGEAFEWMAAHAWQLTGGSRVTLCMEPVPVGPWAQDNGKAGVVVGADGTESGFATLTPRFACVGEGESVFEPGESYLMDGLSAAGHRVIHSPLLFQGGNLLAVREPARSGLTLLVGENEVARNVALGLTREQVVEAFRIEFGAERCVVLPTVSYHLDFDVSARLIDGRVVVFVNDPSAAARAIVALGIQSLERAGFMDAESSRLARAALDAGRDRECLAAIAASRRRWPVSAQGIEGAVSKHFVASPVDDAAGNLETFLLAVDVLEAGLPDAEGAAIIEGNSERKDYLRALRGMEARRQRQLAVLRDELGWELVPVPSMPDLDRSVNYLNGIHHREGYLMPVFGGYFSALDRAAGGVVRRRLGADLQIIPIRSADCQRSHGAVHCAASVF